MYGTADNRLEIVLARTNSCGIEGGTDESIPYASSFTDFIRSTGSRAGERESEMTECFASGSRVSRIGSNRVESRVYGFIGVE
jgi:hypothetical protein